MSTEMRLREIGDQLERAFAAELQAEARVTRAGADRGGRGSWLATRRGRWLASRRGRWLAAAAATVIAVPGVAYATGVFTSPQTVARSLPAGSRIFGNASCVVVRPNVEYRCRLGKPPPPDPITHLTTQQWQKYLAAQGGTDRVLRANRDKVLASFGFTPAQIKAHDRAIDAGSAGIGAGQFQGTVEPTADATHHVDGGCLEISRDGTLWECYIGEAAVTQGTIGQQFLGQYLPGPGVG